MSDLIAYQASGLKLERKLYALIDVQIIEASRAIESAKQPACRSPGSFWESSLFMVLIWAVIFRVQPQPRCNSPSCGPIASTNFLADPALTNCRYALVVNVLEPMQ